MDELAALVDLIERLHQVPASWSRLIDAGIYPDGSPWYSFDRTEQPDYDRSELDDCVGFSEGQACCVDRVRDSEEFAAAGRALGRS